MTRKLVSVITPCFNEANNAETCWETVRNIFERELPDYDLEHIFADNASTDGTADVLRRMAAADTRVKVILNARNFGPFASLFNGILASSGDAVIAFLPADLQDPPELIPEMVRAWRDGYEVVFGIRAQREESRLLAGVRRLYYYLVNRWSNIPIPRDAGEFQLIDRRVVHALRQFDDYYPYVRGMIAACGFRSKGIEYTWRARQRGVSSNNAYRLVDQALNGLISTSNVPMRLCLIAGICIASISIMAALVHLVLNIVFYQLFAPPGIPTLIVALFFFAGVQLFFLGVLGEYISAIHSQVRSRPLVIERERLNFDKPAEPSPNPPAPAL